MTGTKPTLLLDVDEFQHYLDAADMTPDEKREVLETLWEIVCEFVMIGFGVHPVQQIKDLKNPESADQQADDPVQCAEETPVRKIAKTAK